MDQSPEDRKLYLAELKEIAIYTGTILHGDDLSKVRIKQLKKYFNRTYNLLIRLSKIDGDITNKSFRYCYGGKILGRKVLLELGIVQKKENTGKTAIYSFVISPAEINLELVSRIIVEVYLARNDMTEF